MKLSPAKRLYLGLAAVSLLMLLGGILSWWPFPQRARVTGFMLPLNTAIILCIGCILMYFFYKEFYYGQLVRKKLNSKLEEVVTLNRESNDRNWLLSRLNDMKENLLGIHKPESLAYKCLLSFTEHAGFAAGALYEYEKEEALLRLCSSVHLPADIPVQLMPGEGLVGDAATGRDIRIISQLPVNYRNTSAAGARPSPHMLVFVPLLMGDELTGVLELVTAKAVTPLQLQLLELVSGDVAVALHAAREREKVLVLLQQVQEQKEALYGQQEELRQSNEELSRQSEFLQASEEELRVQEEELRQVNAEMAMKNTELETARQALSLKAAELEANSRYKSEFLANMSHELRTPLNSVLILAKMLEENKEGNLFPRQVEYAGIMHKSGSDLLRLINDILDLSKIEAGKVELTPEPVRIAAVIEDLDNLFGVVAQEKQIQYTTEMAVNVPAVITTDRLRLEQVIRNLLSNAFKFTPVGGQISLSWYILPENALCISVTDTGPGIPAEKQQLIFDAFHQGDGATTRKYGGTGLGLSISRELMLLLKGAIHLEKSSPQGSTFTVILPLNAEPLQLRDDTVPGVQNATIRFQTKQNDDGRHLFAGGQQILVIGTEIFTGNKLNVRYDVAANMAVAADLLAAGKYDCIILDMGCLPQAGKAALATLQQMNTVAPTPVIVYIDQDISASEEQQIRKQVAAIIRKTPFPTDRLADELERLLNNKKPPEAAPRLPGHVTKNILAGKKVLLVDDDMRNVFSMSALLEEQGVCVLTAADGREALTVLEGHQMVDLVLMDMMMPEMDGFEAIRHIRNDRRLMQLPVIAITAKAMPGDRQHCLDAGASDYIAKPVDSIKLLSLLHVWLS
ncbi:GAF domain-containing hybrid sensor histidine kinase/response regulator [Chitinophaga varians]|uniref:GAF domain-containing hybrid sensor histidine kinase/response regulator n=1 Tax=Chitinophaga varians TaxID=2202339 RepID=UPI00165ED19C|nr:response regulator [Chitinophaga varians]MBC9913120.1 response regulator [Chitinophaga varians]